MGIMKGFEGVVTNPNALIGKTIGEFNKQFVGRADAAKIKEIITMMV